MTTRPTEWKTLKRLTLQFFSWTLLGMVLAPLALEIAAQVWGMDSHWRLIALWIYLAVVGAGALVLRWRVKAFKCPRCRSSFDTNVWKFRNSCASCGLKVYGEL